jgi:hypothetical protein
MARKSKQKKTAASNMPRKGGRRRSATTGHTTEGSIGVAKGETPVIPVIHTTRGQGIQREVEGDINDEDLNLSPLDQDAGPGPFIDDEWYLDEDVRESFVNARDPAPREHESAAWSDNPGQLPQGRSTKRRTKRKPTPLRPMRARRLR